MNAPTAAPAEATAAQWAAVLIDARRTVLPKRLTEPGPDAQQLEHILAAAAAAPDHGNLVPWRFVIVPATARAALADVFERALVQRDAGATPAQRQQARDKGFRAPLLMLAIARLNGGAEIPPAECLVSAGCAIQNMLLMATAMGYASALTSGKALQSPHLHRLFAVTAQEQPLCFVSVGTAAAHTPRHQRPATARYVSTLAADAWAP